MMNDLNFSVEWVYEKNNLYGTWNRENNSWSGIVGQLAAGEAEMSIFHLSIISSRSLVVSFAKPTGITDNGLYMQNPRQSLSWSTYTKVFSVDYWVMLLFVALLCCD